MYIAFWDILITRSYCISTLHSCQQFMKHESQLFAWSHLYKMVLEVQWSPRKVSWVLIILLRIIASRYGLMVYTAQLHLQGQTFPANQT